MPDRRSPSGSRPHRSFRLTPSDGAGPPLMLPEAEARALLAVARGQDVLHGGRFCAGPGGIQVFDDRGETAWGSVAWSYDTPALQWVTVDRVLVTPAGRLAGETEQSLLVRVLALTGDRSPGQAPRVAPSVDPFRARPRSSS